MNQSLGGLSPKRRPLRSVLEMTRNHSRKGGLKQHPSREGGHSLGANATPQSRDVSPGCSLWLKEETCNGRGKGVVRKGSTVSGWDVLSHRRQCCAGSEAEPCGRELWGHFWDSDVP